MSIKLRRRIGFWVLFLLGMALNGFQTYKYFTGQLEATLLEFAVLVTGVLFNFRPMYIINLFEKFITKRDSDA